MLSFASKNWLVAFAIIGGGSLLLIGEASAMTDADFKDEIEKTEKLINGGYIRIGLMGLCGVAGGIAAFNHNLMGLVIAGVSMFFVHLMRVWIDTNFAGII